MDSGTKPSEEPTTSYVLCSICAKKFSCIQLQNRHKKRIHKIVANSSARESRIICPLCQERKIFDKNEFLRKHLEEEHALNMELLTLQLLNIEEYESWKRSEKIETNYSVHRTNQGNDHKEVIYICKRSDSRGYQQKYVKRTEKSNGTIKIKGMCTSQLIARFYDNGKVSISFWKTHAGHGTSRSLHLSRLEKNMIVEKLKSGVSIDRILKDARIERKPDSPELQRVNLINRDDIAYLIRKHNINRRRDINEMVAATLKVQEWNANGKNFAFFYKPEGALREKLQETITSNYFMSDDDPKYYNAWTKAMGNRPKRLLCTWHVVKNWNIQGKKKIKNEVMRKEMKQEMKRIINETNEDKFIDLVNAYLVKLQEANEMDFVNYLTKYYFQDEDRIKMWAHCYRKSAGINTNMAIESLNNVLKTNQLRRSPRVTIEKLLDGIEELVNIKMWKRITDIARPNANNYQDRVIIKAHKKAEVIKNKVEVIVVSEILGKFQVKSSKDNFYNIDISQICESDCRTLYCRVCKICIDRYKCDCPEYTVKNTMCKHVHLVRMHEESMGTNSTADQTANALAENLVIQTQNNEEIDNFLQEQCTTQQSELTHHNTREVRWTHFKNWAESLNDDVFEKFMNSIQGAIREADKGKFRITKKWKMETQEYFPTKKHRQEYFFLPRLKLLF